MCKKILCKTNPYNGRKYVYIVDKDEENNPEYDDTVHSSIKHLAAEVHQNTHGIMDLIRLRDFILDKSVRVHRDTSDTAAHVRICMCCKKSFDTWSKLLYHFGFFGFPVTQEMISWCKEADGISPSAIVRKVIDKRRKRIQKRRHKIRELSVNIDDVIEHLGEFQI
jgi:hypothetical protein